MCPASYNLWARLMVREGARPRRELAVCCKVEVMKGARGARATLVSLISVMLHLPPLPNFKISSTFFLSVGSFEHMKARLLSKLAVITQKVTGLKARISRSRSMMMRREG